MEQVFERLLIDQCAPTLAGVKPANLFRVGGESVETIRRLAEEWNRRLSAKGLRVMVLKECEAARACMIYVYRVSWLRRILKDGDTRAFLERMGYRTGEGLGMLKLLSRRFCLEQAYPHEVGVFLGYPLEDVVGFIENRGWNYTCCGLWKSYGNPADAQARFAQYRACTSAYQKRYRMGTPVLQLTVAA